MKALQTGFQEERMKIKRAQGFHPRRAKFDFHTNPSESPSNGLSGGTNENIASPRIRPKRAQGYFHTKLKTISVNINEFSPAGTPKTFPH
jgi:hypothetical protein